MATRLTEEVPLVAFGPSTRSLLAQVVTSSRSDDLLSPPSRHRCLGALVAHGPSHDHSSVRGPIIDLASRSVSSRLGRSSGIGPGMSRNAPSRSKNSTRSPRHPGTAINGTLRTVRPPPHAGTATTHLTSDADRLLDSQPLLLGVTGDPAAATFAAPT